jgi:hypothetical protein
MISRICAGRPEPLFTIRKRSHTLLPSSRGFASAEKEATGPTSLRLVATEFASGRSIVGRIECVVAKRDSVA